ncbi:MAG: TrmB family transcriptional regulator, partial [Lentisphaeria bacterium]|nr:TrmB family transcriptional regulator [Lentisphaeria bacterium]
MNIIEQLNMLGLNGRQAKVYLTLLQLGSATAIEIAKA